MSDHLDCRVLNGGRYRVQASSCSHHQNCTRNPLHAQTYLSYTFRCNALWPPVETAKQAETRVETMRFVRLLTSALHLARNRRVAGV
jgi:hypothetical protein